MKSIRKHNRNISLFLLYIFIPLIFESCKPTLISSKTISTEVVRGSEKKTGEVKYTYDVLKKPDILEPTVDLQFLYSDEYIVQTRHKVELNYNTKRRNSSVALGSLVVLPSLTVVAWNSFDSYSEYSSFKDYVFQPEWEIPIGLTFGLLGSLLFITIYTSVAKKTKTSTKYISGIKLDYTNPLPLRNSHISVFENKAYPHLLKRSTNQDGILTVDLVKDFSLISSDSNKPVKININFHDNEFNPLFLTPSHWLQQYYRIDVSECPIRKNIAPNSPVLGVARNGMEFKLLRESSAFLSYKIDFFDKSGWISYECGHSYYSIPKKPDISFAIKSYVEDKFNTWQQQGEFESPENYGKRMLKRDEKLKELTVVAMNLFQEDYIKQIEWKKSHISRYDPNSQTFKVTIPGLQEIVLPVSIDKAQLFKELWDKVVIKNQQFVLIDGSWELSSVDFEISEIHYTANYNSKISHIYDPTNQFAFTLEPVKIIIPSGEQYITAKSDLDDNYSINTNLPVTNMSNPDAIAVVIGNTNYQFTDPVNYALNDAQLMKVYLTNVLGFKSENIIFVQNATKGRFEGIFGTNENFNGQLYKWVKPDISDVFVFYSGHGAPGINDKKGYFVPVDCDPMLIELQGYPLELFYKNLAQIPSKSTTVVIDACFSGAGVYKNISSIRIKPKEIIPQIENSAIITSSAEDQVSSWYNLKQHGLFTYFFLKAIHDMENSDKDKDGNLTFREIFDYISDNTSGVPYYSRRLNNVEQNPVIMGTDKEKVFVNY